MDKIKEIIRAKIKEMSVTGTGGASFSPGTGEGYATPAAFKSKTNSKGTKNIYYYKLGFKPVPNIKPKSYDKKKLWEEGEETGPKKFQNERINEFNQIEDILRLANVKDPAVIAAAERFKGLSKQIEANETRILLGGEGQITEGERRIVTTIVPTLSDPTKVVKAKAELTIARSQFDQERAKAFNAYMRQNKNATYFEADLIAGRDIGKARIEQELTQKAQDLFLAQVKADIERDPGKYINQDVIQELK